MALGLAAVAGEAGLRRQRKQLWLLPPRGVYTYRSSCWTYSDESSFPGKSKADSAAEVLTFVLANPGITRDSCSVDLNNNWHFGV